jgi:hypothetical protein
MITVLLVVVVLVGLVAVSYFLDFNTTDSSTERLPEFDWFEPPQKRSDGDE